MLPRGGLIVVGGPPFSGRSPLGAALADWLPNSLKLESADDLVCETFPRIREAGSGTHATTAILDEAAKTLRAHDSVTLIVVARFETPKARRQACARARQVGAAFLYVEARSSNIRSIRRLLRLRNPSSDPARELELYKAAARRYVPVSTDERRTLPSVLLRAVLSDLDLACSAVLSAWHAGV